jgi:hypothetical protein
MSDSLLTEHRTLEGSFVKVITPATVMPHGATTHLQVSVGGRTVEFESGRLDFVDDIAAALHIKEFDLAFDWHRGVLRLGSHWNGDRVTRLAAWSGESHSLKLAARYTSYEVILDWLQHITVTETPDGVVLEKATTDAPIRFPLEHSPPELTQPLDGAGMLEIVPLAKVVVANLPEWEGLRTPFGEIFIEDEGSSDGPPTFLGPHARIRLHLAPAQPS